MGNYQIWATVVFSFWYLPTCPHRSSTVPSKLRRRRYPTYEESESSVENKVEDLLFNDVGSSPSSICRSTPSIILALTGAILIRELLQSHSMKANEFTAIVDEKIVLVPYR